ncbi:MAG: alcohol dehydrogenase catalytic domain-containing protein [Hyphomicrobium sp.]|nr:alcohol dehydrogenase catalytic domain-containing protein [Hyphomicrobium sp.]
MALDHTVAPLECVTRAVRTPKRGHILIRVGACGICRIDLHVIDGDLAEPQPHAGRDVRARGLHHVSV